MNRTEFQTWYETLGREEQLKVVKFIAVEDFGLDLPEEEIQKIRDVVRDKFLRIDLVHEDQLINPKTTFTVEKMNIPHAARMVSQFRLEERGEGKKTFIGTGKVMCWCNCGEKTDWLDIYTSSRQTNDFFYKHQMSVELGIRMGYVLGELAGYRIESRVDNYGTPEQYIVHRCGWEEEIQTTPGLLTDIVLTIQNDTHICGEKPSHTG